MRAYGHASVWRTYLGVGRTSDAKPWYRQLGGWWAAHQAAHRQATLYALHRCWDAKREAVRPFHADAALDMALAQGTLSLATHPVALAV